MARSGKRGAPRCAAPASRSARSSPARPGFDGLFVIKPDGRMQINTGIGNLGTEAFSDTHRVAAEMMGMPWEKVDLVWGNSSKNLPWSCVSGGSQTDARAHARGARRGD